MRLVSFLICCALTFSGCPLGQPTGAAPVPTLVLRSYEVPMGAGERLRSVLKEVLRAAADGKDGLVGRVDIGPDGRLLVLAPEAVHEGVKALVASVSAKGVTAPEVVTFTYWVVVGTPGAEQPQPMPPELEPALTELKKVEGTLGFSLVEKLTVTSLAGEHGEVNGRDSSVDQYVSNVDDAVTADVRLERFGQRIKTRVRLARGKIVVLASSGVPSKDPGDASKRVFFIVKAATSAGDGR